MNIMRLNIGSGRILKRGFVNIDCRQFVDGNGKSCVDIVMDIERERLPYKDNSVSEIVVENVLEHLGFHRDNPDKLEALIFVLNECHRVLSPMGTLRGNVPLFPSAVAVRDITHKRFFTLESFSFFTGFNPANQSFPAHPKYADYGVKPWYQIHLDDGINFVLRPRKTDVYDPKMETL